MRRDSGPEPILGREARRLHRTLIDVLLATGAVPSGRELADRLRTTEATIRAELAVLAVADYVAFDPAGQVSCLYPFSPAPTSHVVVIAGQPRFAMCAIDALGIPAMLSQTLEIAARCAVCGQPIALRVAPGIMVSTTPPETLVVARRDQAEPAFAACCPFTVFVCGQAHAVQFMRRVAGVHTLPLPEALTHAETIFAGLLAEELPATRPRGKRWSQSRDA